MAEVSIATVSRVLNKTSPVSEDKRERVEMAVRELGYKPNPAAVSLLKGETGGIGVLLPWIGGEYFAELLLGIDTRVHEHGYVLMVSPSHRSVRELEVGLSAIAQRVDGLIVMTPEVDTQTVSRLLPRNIPVVFINTPVQSDSVNAISFDNYGGMKAVAKHLIDLGHQSIDYISGPAAAHDAKERLRGFMDACKEADLNPERCRVFSGDFSPESGYAAAEQIVTAGNLPTAVLAANDLSAQAALSRFRVAGIRIPTELALAGFDNIPSARYMTPPLTTVNVPVRDIGVLALEWLVEKIRNGNSGARQTSMGVELLIRESTTGFGG